MALRALSVLKVQLEVYHDGDAEELAAFAAEAARRALVRVGEDVGSWASCAETRLPAEPVGS